MEKRQKFPRVAREPDPPVGGTVQGRRVAVGMSGGVDSSVSAALLVERGYDVTGVFLECWNEPGCRAPEDRKDALSVALGLGIPFQVLDFQKEYRKKVIEYFYREYEAGRTPNPDVVCNREIKFGLFLRWALNHGFDYVATGHYARIGFGELRSPNGNLLGHQRLRSKLRAKPEVFPGDMPGLGDQRKFVRLPAHPNRDGIGMHHLLQGIDAKKDQSYFLYPLMQEQLAHVLFPVGHLTKKQVRREAKRRRLLTADKPDSVGICFVGEVDVGEFLRRRINEKTGDVVDTDGDVIGKHKGVWFYTIGQRHGFSISNKVQVTSDKLRHAIPPFYVVGKNVVRNQLIVGFGAETFRDKFQVADLHFINGIKNEELTVMKGLQVRIRHGGELISSKLKVKNSKLFVELAEPQRGIAPGKAAVFYLGDECLGGGIIVEQQVSKDSSEKN